MRRLADAPHLGLLYLANQEEMPGRLQLDQGDGTQRSVEPPREVDHHDDVRTPLQRIAKPCDERNA